MPRVMPYILLLGLTLPWWQQNSVPAAEPEAETPALQSVPSPAELIARLKPGHPRLLIDGQRWAWFAEHCTSDPVLKRWDEAIVAEADRLLKAPLPEHVLPDGKRLLSTSRAVMNDVYTLAWVYRVHGDRRYRDRLWQELETVAAFPDFNPKHFLDTAEMTHAFAIAYDWLFDQWSEAERATIRRAIVEMGLKPGLKVYESGKGWPKSPFNWNQVCNGGLAIGALAIGDEEPELAGTILHEAIQSVPRALAGYAPDGGWNEGPGYWNYATSYTVRFLAALRSALGSEFGLADLPGLAETGLFELYNTGPNHRTFNFSDAGDKVGAQGAMFWLAQRYQLPVCAWFAVQHHQRTVNDLLWYEPSTIDPALAGLPRDKYFRGVEVVTMRSVWNDPRALFVGIQAGSNRAGHNHLDLGSFVLEAQGQPWVSDMGGDNYNLPGYFGDQRYTYYRLRAESHNTLLVNPGEGPDQDPKADCKILRFQSDEARAFAVAELTPAYAQHAQRVQRGIALLERRAVLVQDELEAAAPVALRWAVHTASEVSLSDDARTATFERKGKQLMVRLLVPEDAKFEVGPAAPLVSSPNPEGQRQNGEFRCLSISLPQTQTTRLAVLFLPLGEGVDRAWQPPVQPLAQW